MSTTTTNYKMFKPELTDPADITQMNSNWDLIDTELAKRATLDENGKVPAEQLPDDAAYLPLEGGTLTGDLYFKKVNNGIASIFKNHNANTDYGLVLRDTSNNNKISELSISAQDETLMFTINGVPYEVYHEANIYRVTEAQVG